VLRQEGRIRGPDKAKGLAFFRGLGAALLLRIFSEKCPCLDKKISTAPPPVIIIKKRS
jgi:hypothetical protein